MNEVKAYFDKNVDAYRSHHAVIFNGQLMPVLFTEWVDAKIHLMELEKLDARFIYDYWRINRAVSQQVLTLTMDTAGGWKIVRTPGGSSYNLANRPPRTHIGNLASPVK